MRTKDNLSIRKYRKWLKPYIKCTSAENVFIHQIDYNFPYRNKHWARKIIREGLSFSPHAAFAVTDELCRLPGSFQSRKPIKRYAWKYLNAMPRYFSHPLLSLIIDTGNHNYREIDFTDEETMRRMNLVRPYKLHCALSTVFWTCLDEEGKVDELLDAIHTEWRASETL